MQACLEELSVSEEDIAAPDPAGRRVVLVEPDGRRAVVLESADSIDEMICDWLGSARTIEEDEEPAPVKKVTKKTAKKATFIILNSEYNFLIRNQIACLKQQVTEKDAEIKRLKEQN